MMHEAIDRGITFMDNSWDYNEGQSELRMGKALAQEGYRKKAFLMTKLDGRTKEVGHEPARGFPQAPADRPHRSRAVP